MRNGKLISVFSDKLTFVPDGYFSRIPIVQYQDVFARYSPFDRRYWVVGIGCDMSYGVMSDFGDIVEVPTPEFLRLKWDIDWR